jgi:septal ring factor EnvC (AmiA/AmiB activator)
MDFGMSRSVYILIAAILVNIVSIVNAVHDDSKRILINDHDVLNERLQQLENIMAQLQTDIQQLKQDNQQTDNLVKQQAATILSQTNLIRKLESSFTTLQQEYSM